MSIDVDERRENFYHRLCDERGIPITKSQKDFISENVEKMDPTNLTQIDEKIRQMLGLREKGNR